MKRSTKIITTIALTVGLAGGAAALGKHHYGDPAKKAERVAGYIAYELELDDSQKVQLDALKDQLLSARENVKENHDPMKAQAMSLLTAETFDRSAVLDMINTKTTAINEQAPQVINALGDFLDSLNTEQKNEIAEFVNDHHGRHGRKYRK